MDQEQIEQEVACLAEAWATAELQSDTTFLERLLSDDFVGVGPLGFLLSKQEWLAWLQSGDLKHEALTLDEVKVRVYNDAAIVICRLVQDATYRGTPILAQLRTTQVFVRHQGQWQLAGLHECNLGQPPP
jgi:ketosteroid isomerase-like protein